MAPTLASASLLGKIVSTHKAPPLRPSNDKWTNILWRRTWVKWKDYNEWICGPRPDMWKRKRTNCHSRLDPVWWEESRSRKLGVQHQDKEAGTRRLSWSADVNWSLVKDFGSGSRLADTGKIPTVSWARTGRSWRWGAPRCKPWQARERMGHENGCCVSSLTDGSVRKVLKLKNAQSLCHSNPCNAN